MTGQDWIGIVGAAAWLPQILGWLRRAFEEPEIDVVPALVPQVGYTTLGPIFNLTCAISARNMDALINHMSVNIRHENGQELNLNWRTLSETFSNIRTATGESAEISKSQPAIALKISTLDLVEKLIGFQDNSFQAEANRLYALVDEQKLYLQKVNGDNDHALLKSKQFLDLMDFYRGHGFWQEGTYYVCVRTTLVGVAKKSETKFQFSLSKTDIERAGKNINYVEQNFTDVFYPPVVPAKEYPWHWVNPQLIIAQ